MPHSRLPLSLPLSLRSPALTILLWAASALSGIGTAQAAPRLVSVDFSACANLQGDIGGPVGPGAGNAGTPLAKLSFDLLDPALGNNAWAGTAGAKLLIKLSVPSPKGVYLLLNTLYGQSDIVNATVRFSGSGGVKRSFKRVGNKTIRDFNNWVFTNTLTGNTAQPWWTSNPDPHPNDQTHRIDAHKFDLSAAFAGQTLKQIEIDAPADAGPNYMQPLLWAVGVDLGGSGGPVIATCSVR